MTLSRPWPGRNEPLATAVGLALLASVACQPGELVPGESGGRQIAPGEQHRYSLRLDRGSLIEIDIHQEGVDVVTRLMDPQGKQLLQVDRSIGDQGPERLVAVAEAEGRYTLSVEAFDGDRPPGEYRLRLRKPRVASPMDRQRARTVLLVSDGALLLEGRRAQDAQDVQDAKEKFEAALELARTTGDRFWEAESLDRLASALEELAKERGASGAEQEGKSGLEAAVRRYLESSAVWRALGDRRMEGWTLIRAGKARFEAGQLEEAAAHDRDAIHLFQAESDAVGEATGRRNLGQIHRIWGRWQDALGFYQGALELLDRNRDRRLRAEMHHDLGVLYRILGDPVRALHHLRRAEEAWAELGDGRSQATSLNQLGRVLQDLQQRQEALGTLSRALDLRRASQDRGGEANTLVNIGSLLKDLGRPNDARQAFDDALGILGHLDRPDPEVEAKALLALGALQTYRGDPEQALLLLRRSRDHYRGRQNPAGEAQSLLEILKAEAGLGQLAAARQAGEEALDLIEGVRLRTLTPRLRSTFFSTVQPFFDEHIDVLMRSHTQDPSRGFDAQALETSERARMRSLAELLAAAGDDVLGGAQPELVRREQNLRKELNALVERQLELADKGLGAGQESIGEVAEELARGLIETEDALEEIQLEILRDSPRYAALIQPQPLTLAEIRRQVLDEDTLLLEVHLGQNRSYLWLVGPKILRSFELPGRGVLEPLVWRAYEELKDGPATGPSARSKALDQLSRILLQPAVDDLEGRRLAVVPDGALHYLPFAALPDPAAESPEPRPLMVGHEITVLPSASVLAVVRRALGGRPPAPGLLAVLADPVFDRWDPRLRSRPEASPPAEAKPADSLRRLSFSGDEAEQILALVPPSLSFKAVGFEATRDLVLGGRLAGYQIVHLATHVRLQFGQQKVPAILLSGVDEDGQPREGRLFAHDLYRLDLPAELVVLSGCRTALGEEVHGEGLVGLSRGLMYAGTERVVGSLWAVNDLGSVSFMTSFYRHLLAGPPSPAAALRQAQIEQFEAGKPPSIWAPFVLQGDWRSWPALRR